MSGSANTGLQRQDKNQRRPGFEGADSSNKDAVNSQTPLSESQIFQMIYITISSELTMLHQGLDDQCSFQKNGELNASNSRLSNSLM